MFQQSERYVAIKINIKSPFDQSHSQNFSNRKGTVFSGPELLWYCYFWNCSPIQCLLLKLHNLRGSNPQNFPRESLQTRQNQQNSHYKVFALRLPIITYVGLSVI